MKNLDLTGHGLTISAAAVVAVTLFWWLRLVYHDTFSAPDELAVPLALAFLGGILSTAAAVFRGRG